jgi:hypothetical protein
MFFRKLRARRHLRKGVKLLQAWRLQVMQKEFLLLQWSILRHLQDTSWPTWHLRWNQERIREHRLEGSHLVKELSLTLLPFSQRTVPTEGKDATWDMDKSDKKVIENLKNYQYEVEPAEWNIDPGKLETKLKSEEDGKTPPPKEEKKCGLKNCFLHSPQETFPGQITPVCDRGLLMNVQTKEEKEK